MRSIRTILLFALCGSVWAEEEPLRWRTDLAAARKEAVRTGKPLLVTFRCVP